MTIIHQYGDWYTGRLWVGSRLGGLRPCPVP